MSADPTAHAELLASALMALEECGPDVHEAIAASLPAGVMLAQLTDDDLTVELTLRRMARRLDR